MIGSTWQLLVTNLAVVSILLIAWDLSSDLVGKLPRKTRLLLLGLAMGVGAVASIATSEPLPSGVIPDLRSAFIAASAVFGGWTSLAVTTIVTVSFRLFEGGIGAGPGSVGIFLMSALAYAASRLIGDRRKTLTDIIAVAFVASFASILGFLAFPRETWPELFGRSALPMFIFTFVSFISIGILIHRQIRRQELSKSNDIYRAMVRELPDCLNMKDTQGRFLAANPATAELMGAGSSRNLIGKTDFDFYPQEVAERFRQDELEMLRKGEPVRVDQYTTLPNGKPGWLATLKAPFRDQNGRIAGLITYNRDVTEQRRAAQMKNEFISTVSHELRTPLTSIRGSLGLIAAGVAGELPEKAANLVRIAHTNSERLVLLINDILDMEKIESGKMVFDIKKVVLRPVLEDAIAAAGGYMKERQIKLVLIDDAPAAEANIDADRMHQVLANLLSNAIKFSPQEETVTLRSERRPDGTVRISVSDNGSGIPDEFKNRIFGKFEQADGSSTRAKGGTGLGLSIARSIVERMSGQISFESVEGQGTAFHILLPEVSASPPPLHPKHVLICENDPEVSSMIAALLGKDGYSSDVAPDMASAKNLLVSRNYTALTLDAELAGESGATLFRDLRASRRNADIPVIVISAVADEFRQTLNGGAVGIIDWLVKPVDPERLRSALQKVATEPTDPRPRILHVEDDDGVLAIMSAGLGESVCVRSAKSLREARLLLTQERFRLIILDVALPDGSGLDLLPELPAETSVVVFSANEPDQSLGDQVSAVMTKTKASEIDIASLIRGYLTTNGDATT